MALNEDVLWTVLELMHDNSASWTIQILIDPPFESTTTKDHSITVTNLRAKLVLQYSQADINETVRFLKARGYLLTHGYGSAAPEMAYSLSPQAINVLDRRTLPEEEQRAFNKKILEAEKPGVYGIRLNLPELWRRVKAWRGRRRDTAESPRGGFEQ